MSSARPETALSRETMQVYHLVRPGELRLDLVDVPEPAEGELLARVSVALTCATDLKTFERGHARLKVPGGLGHEWSGRVAVLGEGVTGLRPGDRIVTTPTAPCGDCVYCTRSMENLCLHLFDQGVFAAYGEYVVVPRHIVRRNAYVIPDSVSDVEAAFLEPLACVVHGADLVDLSGDRTVVFLGDGPIALLFLQVARMRGVGRMILVGRYPQRLELAREMGADLTIDARQVDPLTAIEAHTDGLGGDTVVECVGRPEAWTQAVELTRRGGEVLLYGGCESGLTIPINTERLHYDEIALKGGFHYTPDSVGRAWEFIRGGRLSLEPLVTHRMPLEELPIAFARMKRREAMKVAIAP